MGQNSEIPNSTQEPKRVYDVGSWEQAHRLVHALKKAGFVDADTPTNQVVQALQQVPNHSPNYTFEAAQQALCQFAKDKNLGCYR